MTTFLVAWAVCAVVACFVITAVVIVVEARDHRAPTTTPTPRIPAQRTPSAAVIVHPVDAVMFDEFLAELMITPHVEAVLS